jgi:hypothetical protein
MVNKTKFNKTWHYGTGKNFSSHLVHSPSFAEEEFNAQADEWFL